jgi:ribosomal protein S18 acetylase RimI-like enzyme
MRIRPLAEQDIAAVAALFRDLAQEFIVHESDAEGAAMFLRENDEAALRRFIGAGTHVYHVADADGGIAGFIAMRDKSHIFHLFVAKAYQGQGLARRLWDVAREASGHVGTFTVNSSNHALGVYAKFGFVRTAPMQCTKGLYYNPMSLG